MGVGPRPATQSSFWALPRRLSRPIPRARPSSPGASRGTPGGPPAPRPSGAGGRSPGPCATSRSHGAGRGPRARSISLRGPPSGRRPGCRPGPSRRPRRAPGGPRPARGPGRSAAPGPRRSAGHRERAPEHSHSPILAITNGEITAGRIPSRVSVNPKRVPDSAMTRSLTAHRPVPPPRTEPWTRAITGTGQVSIASNISAIAIASCSLASTSSSSEACIQVTSAPAQNDGPSPARTTARSRSGGSPARPANVARSSAIRPASNALCRSGRARLTRATASPGPLRSTRSPAPA